MAAITLQTAQASRIAAPSLPEFPFGMRVTTTAIAGLPMAMPVLAAARGLVVSAITRSAGSLLRRVAQLVAGLRPRRGTGPAPDHLRFFGVGGVPEAVPGALGVEGDIARAHRDLVVAVQHDSLAADDKDELLRPRMTVPLVFGATRRENRAAEDHVLGAGGRIHQELHGHAHPALIWAQAGHGRDVTDAYVKGIRHVSPHRVCRTEGCAEQVVQ